MRADGTEEGRATSAFLAALRQRTRPLHAVAEKTGIVADLLRGTADRFGYALYLRNLQPCYRAMEAALDGIARGSALLPLARRQIYRTAAIEADLASIAGPDWRERLPVLEAGARYAARIARSAEGGGAGLIAHVYVRYLGDLNGGKVVRRAVARTLGLAPSELAFYAFAPSGAEADLAAEYREAICRAAVATGAQAAVVEEAARAFACNIDLAAEVAVAAAGRGASPTALSA